jgi:uncharacterized protein YbjT (DUF2867 family)
MTLKEKILVIGSTGSLGTEICRQLVEGGRSIRALVRETSDPVKVQYLRSLGAETVKADLKDPASIETAMEGITAVISSASSTLSTQPGDSIPSVDGQGQLNAVQAAKQAGVERFIFISFPETPDSFPLQDAKRTVESAIMNSGMKYTIWRPTMFMEVWLGPHTGFDYAGRKATIFGNGVNKISWIAIRDVAAFAIQALDNQLAENRIIELGGPEALTPLEVVRIFEEIAGTKFRLQHVPEETLKEQLEQATDPLQKSFAALRLMYARGNEIPMVDTLISFPVVQTQVKEYCRNVLSLTGDLVSELNPS